MTKISLAEVKAAMRDGKFRQSIPSEYKAEVQKYEQNPGCTCNIPIYRTILQHCRKQLQDYYPNREITDPDAELAKMAENHFVVINCHVDELESKLKELAPGRKQIGAARWNDQITVIVNELDVIF